LIEDKTKELNLFGKNNPSLSRADFNCPGGGVMKLDGKTYSGEDQQKPGGDVHLDKVGTPSFNDEWDFVIENYMMGTNDPDVIDSISLVAKNTTTPEKRVETTIEEKKAPVLVPPVKNEVVSVPVIKQENKTVQKTPYEETKITPPTIEEKFTGREKVFIKEIPLTGDSIELDFYDNGEIDGDSISLFLNGKLIFEHIRLTDKAYVVKLSVKELQQSNELTMVAENLGTIPPNTSYMVALVGDKRYDAQLASTENSSAMIKLSKASGHEP
jgi:hypothetical protein